MTQAHQSSWKEDLGNALDAWSSESSNVILSADVDGLLSCALVASRYPTNVIGVYTTTHLVLLDGATPNDAAKALWLDHDVSQMGVRCIGQHLVHHMPEDLLPLREPQSFNPNVWVKQSWKHSFSGRAGKKRDKYPYGTCHFLANAFDFKIPNLDSSVACLFAHADGTWRTVVDYAPNATIWYDLMFEGDQFLLALREQWHLDTALKQRHWEEVEQLLRIGVKNAVSRSKIAILLPPDDQRITGRQSVSFQGTNRQASIDRTRALLVHCSEAVGSEATMGETVTSVISGTHESFYPNRVEDFDELMVENQIFSHAFTDLRTLRFTTGIHLVGE